MREHHRSSCHSGSACELHSVSVDNRAFGRARRMLVLLPHSLSLLAQLHWKLALRYGRLHEVCHLLCWTRHLDLLCIQNQNHAHESNQHCKGVLAHYSLVVYVHHFDLHHQSCWVQIWHKLKSIPINNLYLPHYSQFTCLSYRLVLLNLLSEQRLLKPT